MQRNDPPNHNDPLDTTESSQPQAPPPHSPTSAEQQQEDRLLRRMQMMMSMVLQTIAQDGTLTVDEASQMVADARTAALSMFPGKDLAFELIWRPRFQRLMRERFRLM